MNQKPDFSQTSYDYVAYTDGSCNNFSPFGEGGSAYVIIRCKDNELIRIKERGLLGSTNNRAEMLAILSAVKSVPAGSTLLIKTDSKYCINVLTNISNANRRYKTNSDLIIPYFRTIVDLCKVELAWVKGHAGDYYNEMVDQIANSKMLEVRSHFRIPTYSAKDLKRDLSRAEGCRITKMRDWLGYNPDSKPFRDSIPY